MAPILGRLPGWVHRQEKGVGATRRLLNFFWPVWAVGTRACGGGWMTASPSRIDG